jgi:post-segregation antitoxin (ccd killing protein)
MRAGARSGTLDVKSLARVYYTGHRHGLESMRPPLYDAKAAKQTVSVTINSDLYAQARSFGINTSQIAEEALAQEVARRKAARLKEEVSKDLKALDAYEAEHGSFAEMVRQHYEGSDEAS